MLLEKCSKRHPVLSDVLFSGLIAVSYFLIELYGYWFLSLQGYWNPYLHNPWPLMFGCFWAVMLTGIIRFLPGNVSRAAYGISYFLFTAYTVVQSGYYLLFDEMMWLSDFRYASEGSTYFSILLQYPKSWWLGTFILLAVGGLLTFFYLKPRKSLVAKSLAVLCIAAGIWGAITLPQRIFLQDKEVLSSDNDFGRSQAQEAAYKNMFNTRRLYQICGVFQTAVKDVYAHHIYPITPGYWTERQEAKAEIDAYLQAQNAPVANEMTGLLKDKNVILVLMESVDDWMVGEHTPTLVRLMEEGINFTNFYTPAYGGIRTFNTEFCINTGSFLSSQGGYAFDYVTNSFDHSLANLLKEQGYSPLTFHYNHDLFYSRGVFSPAMGYEDYVSYEDYVPDDSEELFDEELIFNNENLCDLFFREGKRLNFVITRSAHLSYKYNEVLSYRALKKYPEYRGLTGNEETDCALVKARLVDDFFSRMLRELDARGELENTVIIGVTDHYTYGYKDMPSLLELSGVEDEMLLEKTPCFIWSPGLEAREVDKVLNTSDLMPTMMNLLGVESGYDYIGSDAFDDRYDGFVPFSNGRWIHGDTAMDGSKLISISGKSHTVTGEKQAELAARVQEFIRINNLMLETNYYAK